MKIGRNERCPCGSGKKFKKCCGAGGTYTREERGEALIRLDEWIAAFEADERDDAHDEFWGRFIEYSDELPDNLATMSEGAEDAWYSFDRGAEDGETAVDRFLAEADVSDGERQFLEACRRASVRLYSIVGIVPGVSIKLLDVIEGGEITVTERTASRTVGMYEHVVARIVPRGPSGGPEIESGILHIPNMYKDVVIAQIRARRTKFLDANRGEGIDTFYKMLTPMFHDVWAGSFLDAQVPEVRTNRGEVMVPTTVRFDVVDATAFDRALDRPEAERDADGWRVEAFGRIERRGDQVVIETQTVEAGERARTQLEAWAGKAIQHRATVHENLQLAVKDRIRAQFLSGGSISDDDDEAPAIDPEFAEAVVLGHYGGHYRRWVDEPVPALDGATPREASRDPKLRAALLDLVQGLVSMYQKALRDKQPAYDPSWMWAELALVDSEAPRHPPPLVYERVGREVEGTIEIANAVGERVRREEVAVDQALAADLAAQRFLRGPGERTRPYLAMMSEFEAHRRKTFWVDESLAYMLDQTELDVVGRELRVPFPVCAFVFDDRHVLSLAERVLSRRDDDALAGQLLRVVTAHVAERVVGETGETRSLSITFACDALGADLPSLVHHEIPLTDDGRVQGYLDKVARLPPIDPPPPDMNPTRGLLRTVINAILYATSASVEPQTRSPGSTTSGGKSFSSEEVYFLPGTIDITRVRKLQELERAPDGRELLRRHMVRGHWRRAAKTWSDQRLRWIEPYWKGPDMAAIIEQAYRLKP
ncbi:MAG: SEC-C metal-binding domain-containing protein [Proteobacteria bacterium]|nr:SEC-C metal-binding domain-containing protein [Pseudomonadota bacterium]